jgi:hypothetical protein
MHKLPKKFIDRVTESVKNYQRISLQQQKNDVSEADTVTLVKDMLSDVFGFDKYDELTSEHKIKSTFCDLAVKIDGKVKLLIEVKSAGLNLTDAHLKQAIDYGAHHGIHWVVLTNAVEWRLVKIHMVNQIVHEEIARIVFPNLNVRKEDDLQLMYLISREGLMINALQAFHEHAQIINAYTISAILKSEAVIGTVRREIRKIFPEIKITDEVISEIMDREVLKRDTIDSEKAKEAVARIKKANKKLERAKAKIAIAEPAITDAASEAEA